MKMIRATAALLAAVVVLSACPRSYAQSSADADKTLQELRGQVEANRKQLDDLQRRLDERSAGGAAIMPAARPEARFGTGVYVSVEPQLVSFLGVQTGFASANTAAACPGSTCLAPSGDIATVDAARTWSPRFEAGYYLPHAAGVFSVSGFHVQASGHGQFGAGANTIGDVPLDVFDEIHNPNLNAQPLPDSADADLHVLLDQIDLSYGYPVQVSPRLTVTPTLGLRRVTFDYDAQVAFNDSNATFNFSVERSAHMQGTGPRAGLGAAWSIGGGLSLEAEAGAGYLIGNDSAQQILCEGTGFTNPGCGSLHTFALKQSAGYPFGDGQVRLSYNLPARTHLQGLGLWAGWRFSEYFDLYRTADMAGGSMIADSVGNSGPITEQALFRSRSLGMSAVTFGARYLF